MQATFRPVGNGYGYGDGYGNGDGHGDGDGYGDGYGYGYETVSGNPRRVRAAIRARGEE